MRQEPARMTSLVSPTAQDDIDIMQAAQIDSTQFALIYERYFHRIYMYCLRQVGNADEAEDLCSHVFIYAFRGLKHYRGGSVAGWLFRIAYGTVMNHLRKLHRREVPFEDTINNVPSEATEPLETIVQAETHRVIQELIASLSREEQELLSLKIDAGLTSHEIGEILGKSPGAVRTQLHRTIKRLRELYNKTEERKRT